MVVADVADLVETFKLEQEMEFQYFFLYSFRHSTHLSRVVLPRRRLNVLVVWIALELLQVFVVGAEGQAHLNLGLARDLHFAAEGVQSLPQKPPT